MQVINDKSGSLLVTAGELVCFKQSFGNFQRKHLLGSSVSKKFQVIRKAELEKSTCGGLHRSVISNILHQQLPIQSQRSKH